MIAVRHHGGADIKSSTLLESVFQFLAFLFAVCVMLGSVPPFLQGAVCKWEVVHACQMPWTVPACSLALDAAPSCNSASFPQDSLTVLEVVLMWLHLLCPWALVSKVFKKLSLGRI